MIAAAKVRLLAAFALALPSSAVLAQVNAVARPHTAQRVAILNAIRPAVELELGRNVEFVPTCLQVWKGWALVAAEPEVIEHMNADHAETCRLFATKLRGAADGDWRCTGCDPEGLDLQNGRLSLRVPFPQRVKQPGVLRAVLKQMAEQARAK